MATTHYDAFISYSHSADGKLAPAVQNGLQRLGRSWRSVRALKVFRDETGLSVNPHLWSSIQDALEHSRYFVLMASPDAARSEWVNREIESWLTEMPGDRILPVLTDGDLVWDEARNDFDHEASTGVPPALFGRLTEEPRYLDLRWAHHESQLNLRNGRFRDAIADLAAPMHGISKDELQSEDLRQYRRRMRVAWMAGATVVLLAVAAVIGAIVALGARSHANDLTNAAEVERIAAESAAVRQSRPDLARLLAIEAFHRADTAATRAALQQADFSALPVSRVFQAPRTATSTSTFSSTAISRDGTFAAALSLPNSAGDAGRLDVYDTRTGRAIRHVDDVSSGGIALDARGRRVAYTAGNMLHVIDVRSGNTLLTQPGSGLVALSDDGLRVAVVPFSSSSLEVFDISTGRLAGPAIDTTATVTGLALTPDGTRVAAIVGGGFALVGNDGPSRALTGAAPTTIQPVQSSAAVLYWDVASGSILRIPGASGTGSPTGITGLSFAPGGDRLAIASAASGVDVVDLATGATRTVPGTSAAFAAEGTLLTVWADGTFTRFDPATGRERGVPGRLPAVASGPMAWRAPAGLVTAGAQITVWSAGGTGALSGRVLGVAGAHVVALSPDGRRIALQLHPPLSDSFQTSDASDAELVDTGSGRALLTTTARTIQPRLLVPGGTRLVGFGGSEPGYTLVRLPGMHPVAHVVPTALMYPTGVAASPDGRLIAVATQSLEVPTHTSHVEVFDARTGRTRGKPVSLGSHDAQQLVWSPDDRQVLAIASGSPPTLVDLRKGRVVALPRPARIAVTSGAYSPDGRVVAFGVDDGAVCFDARTWAQIGVPWQEPDARPTSAVFSPDGSLLAVAVPDSDLQTVSVVDVASRTTVAAFPDGVLAPLAFRDRHTLVAPGPGGVFRWTLDPEALVRAGCAAVGHNLSRSDWNRYLPSGSSYRRTCSAYPEGG